MAWEFEVNLSGLDWDRDDVVDRLMESCGGSRVASGSDGKTRDLRYSFEHETDAKSAITSLLGSKSWKQVVKLGPLEKVEMDGAETGEPVASNREDVNAVLQDLAFLEETETALRELHDRVCGEGMFLAPGESSLGEVGYDIRQDCYTRLGKLVAESLPLGQKDGPKIEHLKLEELF